MRRTRPQSRKDSNHRELVDHWLSLGGTSWQDTCELPSGALDGIAGAYGIDQRVEIKDGSKPPSKRLITDAEAFTLARWNGRPPVVWKSVTDVEDTHREMATESGLQ